MSTSRPKLKKTTSTINYSKKFIDVKTQNDILTTQYRDIEENYSTDEKKTYYLKQKLFSLKSLNYFLFYIYYVFAVVLSYVMIMYYNIGKYSKFFVIILLLILPFTIIVIEDFFIDRFEYVSSIMKGQIYVKK
jgi:ABC-type transport system involved in cytochrome bd biosynthesis fused ATPase/permease subunit